MMRGGLLILWFLWFLWQQTTGGTVLLLAFVALWFFVRDLSSDRVFKQPSWDDHFTPGRCSYVKREQLFSISWWWCSASATIHIVLRWREITTLIRAVIKFKWVDSAIGESIFTVDTWKAKTSPYRWESRAEVILDSYRTLVRRGERRFAICICATQRLTSIKRG